MFLEERPYRPDRIAVELIFGGDFEWIADSTTSPPKRGAYWRGAFAPIAEDPADLIERDEDDHVLVLAPSDGEVSQITTPLGPFDRDLLLSLDVRPLDPGARLRLRLAFEGRRSVTLRLGGDGSLDRVARSEPVAGGWRRWQVAAGRLALERTGLPPGAWCRVALSASGGRVAVDGVSLRHEIPRTEAPLLREMLLEDVRDALRIHLAGPNDPEMPGLGLVDPKTGYLLRPDYDVSTGEVGSPAGFLGISGIHDLMVEYLKTGDADPGTRRLRALVRDRLRRHLENVLDHNVAPETGLYCLYDPAEDRPFLDAALSPTHFITYVLDAAELLQNEELERRALEAAERVALMLVRLRSEHDLPPEVPFGRGAGGNWYGRLPDRITARGELPPPRAKTYDQAWAIRQNRSWYHDFDPLVGIMRVHALRPRPEYLDCVQQVLRRFDRKWDATRYDLENDTDDHYGKNVESALEAYRVSGATVRGLLAFAQAATDHRLNRGPEWERSIWIEGNRLGSFTTGDQPRAYLGPAGLYQLPPEANPVSSGEPAYRHALAELARSDLKRRVLDDGWLTEASSYQWEMIAACFVGDYIGPCSENRPWEGDMGDQFAGPSANAFRALGRALRVLRPGEDREFLSWYALLHLHTLERYRLPYGYLYGLPIDTGRRYGIPARYLHGFLTRPPYGFAVFSVHAETLVHTLLGRRPAPRIGAVTRRGASLSVEAPSGATVKIRTAPRAAPQTVSRTDFRLLTCPAATPWTSVRAVSGGRAEIPIPPGARFFDAMLVDSEGVVVDVATGVLPN